MTVIGYSCSGIERLLGIFNIGYCEPTALELLIPLGLLLILYTLHRNFSSRSKVILGMAVGVLMLAVPIITPITAYSDPVKPSETKDRIDETCEAHCSGIGETLNSEKVSETKPETLPRIIEYCSQTFSWNKNNNGLRNDVVYNGYNSYCEDGVRCFNVMNCRVNQMDIDANTCRKAFERYYREVNKDNSSELRKHVRGLFRERGNTSATTFEEVHVGSCDLHNLHKRNSSINETWLSNIMDSKLFN